MAKRRKKRSDVLEILDRRVPPTATDLKMREVFRERMEVAELIHAARTNAGSAPRHGSREVQRRRGGRSDPRATP